jgi:hypothetical protein
MRTRTPRLPTPIALVVLAGCVLYFDAREDDRPPPPTEAARVLFERDVYPILMEKCVSCHATTSPSALGFVDLDPTGAYDAIVNTPAVVGDFSPAEAPIVTTADQKHAPAAYTTDERAKIVNWLTTEVEERQGSAPAAPFADQQLREWSGCMSYDDFLASNMSEAWAGMSSDAGACESCHGTATAAALASSADPQTFFRALTESRTVLLTFFAVDISTGISSPQIVVNADGLSRIANGSGMDVAHPKFSLDGPAMVALRSFYELTHARQLEQICEPPRLKD